MQIGNLNLAGNIFLAPLAGITDKAFRVITKPYGPALMYTEMVSGKGLHYNNKRTGDLLEISDFEKPAAVQLFGHEPEILGGIAEAALENGASLIDINMGCPAPKIVKNGDGCALMKSPKLAADIVRAVSKAVDVPVTVKFRMGWDDNSVNAVEFAKVAEDAGAAAVTVHGRTREAFYSGGVNLEIIRRVKEAVKIPVIGNGDIVDGKSAKNMIEKTGCDGIMIGRAARGNPWIFSEVTQYLKDGTVVSPPNAQERVDKALEHLALLVKFKGEHRGVLEGRKHMTWYFKGLSGGAELRCLINSAASYDEMRNIILNAQKERRCFES